MDIRVLTSTQSCYDIVYSIENNMYFIICEGTVQLHALNYKGELVYSVPVVPGGFNLLHIVMTMDDARGDIYVAGLVKDGTQFDGQTLIGGEDGFVTKYSITSMSRVWTRVFGSTGSDRPYDIEFDTRNGRIYIFGSSTGNFGGIPNMGSWDIFIICFDSDGIKLWSTAFGTSGYDRSFSLTLGASVDEVFYTGSTSNWNSMFLARYTADGNRTLFSSTAFTAELQKFRYVPSHDLIYGVGDATDPIFGWSPSGVDSMIIRYFPSNLTRLPPTYWFSSIDAGGGDDDYEWNLEVSTDNNEIYVVGTTTGRFPGQTLSGYYDGYIVALSMSGTVLWSKQFGSANFDGSGGISQGLSNHLIFSGMYNDDYGGFGVITDVYMASIYIISVTPRPYDRLWNNTITLSLDRNTTAVRNLNLLQVPVITVEGFTCSSVTWVSNLTLSCVPPNVVGRNAVLKADFSMFNVTYVSRARVRYAPPNISLVNSTNGPCVGGTNITVIATGLGMLGIHFPTVYIGNNACPTTQRIDNTTLVCTVPAHVGPATVQVRVLAGDQNSTRPVYYTYDAPVVSSIANPSTYINEGGETILITGFNFGVCASNCPNITATIGGKTCRNVVRLSDSQLNCVSPAGIGGNLPVIVTSNNVSSTPKLLFSYRLPVVSAVSPERAYDGNSLLVSGQNFGSYSNPILFTFVSMSNPLITMSCAATWLSSSNTTCTLPLGMGSGKWIVRVTVGGQISTDNNVILRSNDYNTPPIVQNVTIDISANDLPTQIQLTATDIDLEGFTLSLRSLPQNGVIHQYSSASTNLVGSRIFSAPSAILDEKGRCIYIPNSDFAGSDSFSYYATDVRGGESTDGAVFIHITPKVQSWLSTQQDMFFIMVVVGVVGVVLLIAVIGCIVFCLRRRANQPKKRDPHTATDDVPDASASLVYETLTGFSSSSSDTQGGLTTLVGTVHELSIPAYLKLIYGFEYGLGAQIGSGGAGQIYSKLLQM